MAIVLVILARVAVSRTLKRLPLLTRSTWDRMTWPWFLESTPSKKGNRQVDSHLRRAPGNARSMVGRTLLVQHALLHPKIHLAGDTLANTLVNPLPTHIVFRSTTYLVARP